MQKLQLVSNQIACLIMGTLEPVAWLDSQKMQLLDGRMLWQSAVKNVLLACCKVLSFLFVVLHPGNTPTGY